MKHPANLRMAALHLAALCALSAAAALGLVSCGQQDRNKIGVDKPVGPPPDGPHLDLAIQAPMDTHYQMLCDVRTYQAAPGQIANRFGVDKSGPYHDYIPSPNAHCTAKIVSGSGPLKITLSKPGAVKTMTITTVGEAGKNIMHVW